MPPILLAVCISISIIFGFIVAYFHFSTDRARYYQKGLTDGEQERLNLRDKLAEAGREREQDQQNTTALRQQMEALRAQGGPDGSGADDTQIAELKAAFEAKTAELLQAERQQGEAARYAAEKMLQETNERLAAAESEREQARVQADEAQVQAQQAQVQAEQARAHAEQAKAEAEQAKAQVAEALQSQTGATATGLLQEAGISEEEVQRRIAEAVAAAQVQQPPASDVPMDAQARESLLAATQALRQQNGVLEGELNAVRAEMTTLRELSQANAGADGTMGAPPTGLGSGTSNDALVTELSEVRSALTHAEQAREAAEVALTEARSRASQAEMQAAEAMSAVQAGNENQARITQAHTELQDTATAELAGLRAQLASAEQQLADAQTRHTEALAQWSQATPADPQAETKLSDTKARLGETETKLAETENQLNQLRTQLAAVQDQAAVAEATASRTEADIQLAREENKTLLLMYEEAEAKIRDAEARITAVQDEHGVMLADAQGAAQEATTKLAAERDAAQERQEKLAAIEAERDAVHLTCQGLQAELEELKSASQTHAATIAETGELRTKVQTLETNLSETIQSHQTVAAQMSTELHSLRQIANLSRALCDSAQRYSARSAQWRSECESVLRGLESNASAFADEVLAPALQLESSLPANAPNQQETSASQTPAETVQALSDALASTNATDHDSLDLNATLELSAEASS